MLNPVPIATVTGKQLRVDSVHGVDATARPYFEDLPFKTLAPAQAIAASGDTILAGPGAYTPSGTIAKNGVGWDAGPGVTITDSSEGALNTAILDDGGAAMNFAFIGAAVLYRTATVSTTGTYTVKVSHADSNISIEARQIRVAGPAGGTGTGVFQDNGTLWVKADHILSDGPSNSSPAVWWNNGSMNVVADRIESNTYGFYADCPAATPTGEGNVTCNELIGLTAYFSLGQEPTAAAWVRALTVRARGTNAIAVAASGSIRNYVVTQKIFGPVVCSTGDGLTYVETIKWSAIQNGTPSSPNYPMFLRTGASYSGTLRIKAWDVDPVAFTGTAFKIEGGTVEIRGLRYIANSGSEGILLNGGTLRLVDCYIDTSANASTFPIVKEGGTLELINAVLIPAAGVNVIQASTPQTVIVRGRSVFKGPLSSNVTIATDVSPLLSWVTPAQLTADQNNYNPGQGDYFRVSSDASRAITGLDATIGAGGGPKHFVNVGSNNITFPNESGSSSAANRFITADGATSTLLPGRLAGLSYDPVSARWRVYV